jgi:hypothetical protein
MAILAADMVNNVLLALNEAANTPAGALGGGVDATDVITTANAIKGYLSDAGSLIAMTCVPMIDTFTGTMTSGSIDILAHSLTPAGSETGQLWMPRNVKLAGAPLQFIGRDVAEIFNPGLATSAPGTPRYWWFDGGLIGTDVPVSADRALSVEAYATPKAFSGGVTSWSWLPDRDHVLPEYYAEVRLAYKNMTDGQLGPRAASCAADFDSACLQRWSNLPFISRRLVFKNPPLPLLRQIQQQGA